MDVKIDNDAMQGLVTKAIFDGMTQEKRDALVQGAIKSLLDTPPRNSYGREQKSPLQEAFDRAAYDVALSAARQKLAEDPTFQAGMMGLFADVAKRLFADDIRDQVVAKIADAVVTGLGERYR